MSKHITVSPNEAADSLAIREVVEAYAYCADRRDAQGQMSLYRRQPVLRKNSMDIDPSFECSAFCSLLPGVSLVGTAA
jgi:hypothetical protein